MGARVKLAPSAQRRARGAAAQLNLVQAVVGAADDRAVAVNREAEEIPFRDGRDAARRVNRTGGPLRRRSDKYRRRAARAEVQRRPRAGLVYKRWAVSIIGSVDASEDSSCGCTAGYSEAG